VVEYFERSAFSQKSLLRRNLHRLEKGLTAENRQRVFAEAYIEETVVAFANEVRCSTDYPSLQWAYDVLIRFFEVVGKTAAIDQAWTRFRSIDVSALKFDINNKYVPRKFTSSQDPVVSYEEFSALCKNRSSIRSYQNRPVPRDTLESAIETSLNSPSACNRQPFEFRVFDQPERLKAVVNLPIGARTFAQGIPAMIFLVGNLSAYGSERDRHLIYIDGGLITMSFILALETLGLASCVIGWPDIESNEKELAKILNLKKHQRCILCISVGYPNRIMEVPHSQKKSMGEILIYDK
jgi:nitroreductase